MTCKEKFRQDHPELSEFEFGLTIGSKCPSDFGYPENAELHCTFDADSCSKCWDQPYTLEELSVEVVNSPAVQAWIEHMEEKEGHPDPVGEPGVPGVPGIPVIKDPGNRREMPIENRKDTNMVETKIDLESMVDLVCDARIKLTKHGFTNVEAFWIIKTLLEGIVK
jgi:hypothetical protein